MRGDTQSNNNSDRWITVPMFAAKQIDKEEICTFEHFMNLGANL